MQLSNTQEDKVQKRLFILILEFSAGLFGNLIAGWIQQDVLTNIFTPTRIAASIACSLIAIVIIGRLDNDSSEKFQLTAQGAYKYSSYGHERESLPGETFEAKRRLIALQFTVKNTYSHAIYLQKMKIRIYAQPKFGVGIDRFLEFENTRGADIFGVKVHGIGVFPLELRKVRGIPTPDIVSSNDLAHELLNWNSKEYVHFDEVDTFMLEAGQSESWVLIFGFDHSHSVLMDEGNIEFTKARIQLGSDVGNASVSAKLKTIPDKNERDWNNPEFYEKYLRAWQPLPEEQNQQIMQETIDIIRQMPNEIEDRIGVFTQIKGKTRNGLWYCAYFFIHFPDLLKLHRNIKQNNVVNLSDYKANLLMADYGEPDINVRLYAAQNYHFSETFIALLIDDELSLPDHAPLVADAERMVSEQPFSPHRAAIELQDKGHDFKFDEANPNSLNVESVYYLRVGGSLIAPTKYYEKDLMYFMERVREINAIYDPDQEKNLYAFRRAGNISSLVN